MAQRIKLRDFKKLITKGHAAGYLRRDVLERLFRRRMKNVGKIPAKFLTMGKSEEVREAAAKGLMAFRIGSGTKERQVMLPLRVEAKIQQDIKPCKLVAAFTVGKRLYTARFDLDEERILIFEVRKGSETPVEPLQYISCRPEDMGHLLMSKFEGTFVTLPLMRIATDHAIATSGKAVAEVFLSNFEKVFRRLGYKIVGEQPIPPLRLVQIIQHNERIKEIGGNYEKAGIMNKVKTMVKEGEKNGLNNLYSSHRILAIGTRIGKPKSFYVG